MRDASPAAPRPVTPLGILSMRLDAMVDGLDDGDVSASAIELRTVAELARGLDPYLERHCAAPSPVQRSIAERTERHDWTNGHTVDGLEQEMLSGNVEAQTLAMLVRATRARRVLEIGTFTGYATVAMAEALAADGVVVTCERDEATARLAREAFDETPAAARIDLRVGPALQTLAQLADEGAEFDLVFLDADKAGYRSYVETLLDTGLLTPEGLLCIDNTLMQGEPWTGPSSANGHAIAEFNDWLANDPRVTQVIVPIRDGLTLARRARVTHS